MYKNTNRHDIYCLRFCILFQVFGATNYESTTRFMASHQVLKKIQAVVIFTIERVCYDNTHAQQSFTRIS